MIPRMRFDIGYSDLLYGLRQVFWPGDRRAAQRRVEEIWSDQRDCLASLSLRSAFDVALRACGFPAGSEVLMSSLNISPMADIVAAHGLVPIPIDLDMDTTGMRQDLLERAVNEKTRAIVFAHVLGVRHPMDDLVQFAAEHECVLFEDCAQAYRADGWTGDSRCDVTMFSFGPIKTCSATMGGVARYKDRQLLEKARRLQSRMPVQSRWQFGDRLMRILELKFLTEPIPFSLLMRLARLLGLEESLNAPVRNFRGRKQLRWLRTQPGYPLLALMERRLRTFDPARVRRRIAAARTVLERMPAVPRPARQAADHSYWLFPVYATDPAALRRHLHRHGFDSTVGQTSFGALEHPPDKPEFEPRAAKRAMQRVLYLPVYDGIPRDQLLRLARAVLELEPEWSDEVTATPQSTPASPRPASRSKVQRVSAR